MKAWNGQSLNTPLTDIAEKDGMISFRVNGGVTDSDTTLVLEADTTLVKARSFTAEWKPVEGAERYEVFVHFDSELGPKVMEGARSAFAFDAGKVTSLEITGLHPDTWYSYRVVAYQAGKGASPVSNMVRVKTKEAIDDNSGIDGIADEISDLNAPVEYFNLQGLRIVNPAKGQIVIMRQGSKARKIRF